MERRFSTEYGLFPSLEKLLSIYGAIAKEPLVFKFQDRERVILPPDNIFISPNLYRYYDCRDYACSRCCWKVRDWNIFTPEQFSEIPEGDRVGSTNTVTILINGMEQNFYVEDNRKEVCKHLDTEHNLCEIHEVNPIHCALPLIKFKRTERGNNDTITYITREVYSRNRFMECPVSFGNFDEMAIKKTLWILGRVQETGNELGIPTSIKEIISAVKDRHIGRIC